MKILFIYFEMGMQIYNPLGICYLSAILKENNHQVSLIRVNKAKGFKRLIREIKKLNPDIIAFSLVSSFAYLVKTLSSLIKEFYKGPIIAGGSHATVAPLELLSFKGIDFVCIGEGETALLELLTKLEKGEDTSKISNIWVKKDGQVIKNPLRERVNLDDLPLPDIDMFYNHPREVKRLTLMTQRGCPYNCTYCCNEYFNKLYACKDDVVRKQSLDKVINEIEILIKKYPNLKWIHFEDDTFNIDKKRTERFCSLYQSKFSIPFSINSRPELIDTNIAKALKEAGCARVCMGVESGDEEFRNKYLNRKISNDIIYRAFAILKEAEIPTRAYFIYGFPYESEENMHNSFSMLKQLNPTDGSQVSVFYPYPKTSLYELSRKLNLLTKTKKLYYYGNKTILNFSKTKKKIIKRYYELSEDFHHNSHNDLVFLKSFYPYLVIPYILLRRIIPAKIIWRFMYKTKAEYLKIPFELKAGWQSENKKES